VTPLGRCRLHVELNALGNVIRQGVVDLRDEDAREALRVGKEGGLFAVAQLPEDGVERGPRETCRPGRPVNEVEDRVVLPRCQQSPLARLLSLLALEDDGSVLEKPHPIAEDDVAVVAIHHQRHDLIAAQPVILQQLRQIILDLKGLRL